MKTSPLLLLLAAVPALPCELPQQEPHLVEPAEQLIDDTPPGRAILTGVTVSRGRGPALGCTGLTSCDDLGVITLEIDQPTDDRTPTEELGYRLGLSAGALPEGLTLPEKIKARDGVIDLVWIDGATDAQDAFAFELSVAAIDLADNFGAFSTSIRVEHPGGFIGCSSGSAGAPIFFVLVLMHAIRSRSRARRVLRSV